MTDEKKDDGGPAFPRPAYEIESVTRDNVIWGSGQSGMTLRDYFAGQALCGLCALPPEAMTDADNEPLGTAALAYRFADAMLEARKKGS